jgi:hypothetical protein
MKSDKEVEKTLTGLSSLELINCTNLLDMSGKDNWPTTDYLTLSGLDSETHQTLSKFMKTQFQAHEFLDSEITKTQALSDLRHAFS